MSHWYEKKSETEGRRNDSYWDRPTETSAQGPATSIGRPIVDDNAARAGKEFFTRVAANPSAPVRPTPTEYRIETGHPAERQNPVPLASRLGIVAAAAAVILIAGIALVSLGGESDDAAPPIDDPTDSPITTEVEVDQPLTGTCPDLSTSLEQINAATYVIAAEYRQAGSRGGPVFVNVGTAWAVDQHILVTNAHITQQFVDWAEQGVQFDRIIGVQAGTGEVVTLTRELTHPNYDGDPLRSPDVGLFTTLEALPSTLPLAGSETEIALGNEVQIVGFPGDVTEFIEITPGETVPQATSLTGRVTARRSHDDTEIVNGDNLDVIQHQAPTTPGTSGSSLVSCGQVIGVNNAGTVKLVVVPGDDGELTFDRQAAAANNFAVHHRHIRTLLTLFDNNAVQGTAMPPQAAGGGNQP